MQVRLRGKLLGWWGLLCRNFGDLWRRDFQFMPERLLSQAILALNVLPRCEPAFVEAESDPLFLNQ